MDQGRIEHVLTRWIGIWARYGGRAGPEADLTGAAGLAAAERSMGERAPTGSRESAGLIGAAGFSGAMTTSRATARDGGTAGAAGALRWAEDEVNPHHDPLVAGGSGARRP